MKELDYELIASESFRNFKEEVMEEGKRMLLSADMQKKLMTESEEIWLGYFKDGYSPLMAVDDWSESL